jgi:hypothetical protein
MDDFGDQGVTESYIANYLKETDCEVVDLLLVALRRVQ